MTDTCKFCRYYSPDLSTISAVKFLPGVGECRRHAPRGPVVLAWMEGDDVKNQAVFSAFPPVPHDDWCGDWRSPTATRGPV